MLKQRVNDGGLLRLISKWLNMGAAEGDVISYSEKGTRKEWSLRSDYRRTG